MIRGSSILIIVACFLPAFVSAQEYPQDRKLPDNVDVVRDVVYASYGDRDLLLDLYLPSEKPSGLLQTIVVITGGGWLEGAKEGLGYMAAALAERNFAAISIEYRAAGEATYPAAVHDTKAAVRWIRANAKHYGLDPDAIGAIGGSAGAHLALLLGLTSEDAELEGTGGNPVYSSSISAVVAMAPAAWLQPRWENAQQWMGVSYEENPSLWNSAAPINRVTNSAAPLLLIHGVWDGIVSFREHSLDLAVQYGRNRVMVEVVLIPNMSHAFWASSWEWFYESVDRATVFFKAQFEKID